MQTAVIQSIPTASILLAAVMNSHAMDRSTLGTSRAATIEWRLSCGLPTQSFSHAGAEASTPTLAVPALSLIALADKALTGSRPLTNSERKDADDFFWAQFE